jgi:hypothetical protein
VTKIIARSQYTNPEISKERFIKTATNAKIANDLLSLCLVAAASHSEFRLKEFIRKQCSNGNLDFIEALRSMKQNDLLYYDGHWRVSTLHFDG